MAKCLKSCYFPSVAHFGCEHGQDKLQNKINGLYTGYGTKGAKIMENAKIITDSLGPSSADYSPNQQSEMCETCNQTFEIAGPAVRSILQTITDQIDEITRLKSKNSILKIKNRVKIT